MAGFRVSPPKVFPVATAAPRPSLEAGGSADAFRQTAFVLEGDVQLVLDGLNAEGRAAEASSGSKHRTQQLASALGLWSRAWLSRLQALHALQWGNYAAAITLVRAAADYQASMVYLLRTEAAEWEEWLEGGGIALAAPQHATQYRLHAFRAAEVLAAHPILGPLYRTATDLSLSHFGSTLLFAGNESDAERVAITFGDRDFHLGLAELLLGWLLELGVAQVDALHEFDSVFAAEALSPLDTWCAKARHSIASEGRCTVETIEVDGERRYLVSQWRREPRSAPRRILL